MARILIIDDEELVRWALRLALERDGHQVAEAENGIHGMEAMAGQEADLVIVDLLMPERDGFQTIQDIRLRDLRLPVVAITGGGPTGLDSPLKRAQALGADFTLTKPVERAVLLETVDKALAKRQPTPA